MHQRRSGRRANISKRVLKRTYFVNILIGDKHDFLKGSGYKVSIKIQRAGYVPNHKIDYEIVKFGLREWFDYLYHQTRYERPP